MKQQFLIPTLILLVLLALASSSVSASPALISGLPEDTGETPFVPGNYCISCHLADDPRLGSVTAWKGSITREENSACPAATKIHEELYYTERLMLMIDRAEGAVGDLPEKTQNRLDGYSQRYSRMLDVPVASLDAFVSEAQTTRYLLNKAYTVLNEMEESAKQNTVLLYIVVITLIVLGSLAWGLFNTRAIRAGIVSKSWAAFWRVMFILAVLAFFALPIFRVPTAEVVMTTTEQQMAQTTLDTAQRAADAADRSQARAWMLAQVGSAWRELDSAQALSLMEESLTSLAIARENEDALWGQSLAVQEVTVGSQVEMEAAGLIAADLKASRSRAWALPLIAVEWNAFDPARASALLEAEREALKDQSGFYIDLQMRGLALAWAKVDDNKAAPIAALIADPGLRAWTFRELSILTNNASLFNDAVAAAREIHNPVQRARALGEIAQVSGEDALFEEALAAISDGTGASLAYAISDLAVSSENVALVERIDPAHPDARADALLRLGEYQSAWEAASEILDPYERARAQSAIASAWGNGDAAVQINVPLYRDLALRDVIQKTGNATLVSSISSNYYKIQALTAIKDTESALKLTDNLGEPYPLVGLAVSLAEMDAQSALDLVEKMNREADKAIVLRALVAETKDPHLFDQAQGMALASRVRGDALVPVQALMDLALEFQTIDNRYLSDTFRHAYEAAQRISTK